MDMTLKWIVTGPGGRAEQECLSICALFSILAKRSENFMMRVLLSCPIPIEIYDFNLNL